MSLILDKLPKTRAIFVPIPALRRLNDRIPKLRPGLWLLALRSEHLWRNPCILLEDPVESSLGIEAGIESDTENIKVSMSRVTQALLYFFHPKFINKCVEVLFQRLIDRTRIFLFSSRRRIKTLKSIKFFRY